MSRWEWLRALVELLDQSHADGPATGLSGASAEELAKSVTSDTSGLFECSAESSGVSAQPCRRGRRAVADGVDVT